MAAAAALPAEVAALLAGAAPVAAAVYSPRTGRILARLAPRPLAPLHVAAISEAAAEAVSDLPLAGLRIARAPDREGMLAACAALLPELSGGAAR